MIPPRIRAVLFDVYGTLLDGPRHPDRDACIAPILRQFGLGPTNRVAARWDEAVQRVHDRSEEPYPEIEAREIWQEIFPQLFDVEGFALAVEEAIHPVAPTHWAKAMLTAARGEHRLVGMVSNAQAYTWHLLDRHFPNAFDPRICALSYQYRIAKPDRRLFEIALAPLLERGLQPGEVLFIGDSPELDGIPARALGMRFLQVGVES